MINRLLHIFRNTPIGRETLFQSIYFCKQVGAIPVIYIPEFPKFLMYFENDVVQVDLDDSYLISKDTALEHVAEILEQKNIKSDFIKPQNFTASTLPDIPINFDFMCCPRSISDLSSKIGLGYIGPRVRWIVKSAHFPVLITSPNYKKWISISIFFGGSANALNAIKLALRISRTANMPLDVFTQLGKKSPDYYKQIIKNKDLEDALNQNLRKWYFFDKGNFEENLYNVPHNSLVIVGAYGHGLIKEMLFGSKMEKIQSIISNNLLIVGPKYVNFQTN